MSREDRAAAALELEVDKVMGMSSQELFRNAARHAVQGAEDLSAHRGTGRFEAATALATMALFVQFQETGVLSLPRDA